MKYALFAAITLLAQSSYASDCAKTVEPLASKLQSSPLVEAIIESQPSTRIPDGEAINRTSIHFNDNSTAQIIQAACYLNRYSFRIEYQSDDQRVTAKLAERLTALVAATPLASEWQKLKFDYGKMLAETVPHALQTAPGTSLVLDDKLTWDGANGDYATATLVNLKLDELSVGTRLLVLTIEIGPEVDVGEDN